MSDFLTRLVTATYVPTASVRPRPIAHYEPQGAALPVRPAGDETASEAEMATGARSVHASENQPGRAVRQRAGAEPQTSSAPRPLPMDARLPPAKSIAALAQAASQSAIPITPPTTEPLMPHRTRSEDVTTLPAATATLAGQSREAPAAAHQIITEAPRRPAPGQAAPLRAAVTPQPYRSAPVRERDAEAGDHAGQPISLAARREQAQPTAAPTPAPRAVGETRDAQDTAGRATLRAGQVANSPRAALSAPPAHATPPPVIRVSIGRIVVKAERPVAPAARNSASRPALSLDGYLKTRNGGDV
ncbi:MAG: hypothetical protein IPM07_20865 [Anaerolineales bacterium]|nr:hypothetical protein [Anaerolineales bacterium]